jgi:hypothetical protein
MFGNHISSFPLSLKASFRNISIDPIYEVEIRRIIPPVSTLSVEAFGRNYHIEPELAGERGPDVLLQAVGTRDHTRNMRAWVSQPRQASVWNRPGTSTVKQTRLHNLRVILNLNPLDGKPRFNRFDETRSWFHDYFIAVPEVTAFERGANDYVCVPLRPAWFTTTKVCASKSVTSGRRPDPPPLISFGVYQAADMWRLFGSRHDRRVGPPSLVVYVNADQPRGTAA